MSKNHNKKRNIGIIFEQLMQYSIHALLEKRYTDATTAKEIIAESFCENSELLKEFKLFNALTKTRGLMPEIAMRILEESHKGSKGWDSHKLLHEKSILIKKINHRLKDENFYTRKVAHYRQYATIQTLLNDWRAKGNKNLERIARYENIVMEHLTTQSKKSGELSRKDGQLNMNPDNLVVKILREKFNAKYDRILNENQADIIREYAFSTAETASQRDIFKKKLLEIKVECLEKLSQFECICENAVVGAKITTVKQKIEALEEPVEVDDNFVSRILTLSALTKELTGALHE